LSRGICSQKSSGGGIAPQRRQATHRVCVLADFGKNKENTFSIEKIEEY